MQGHTLTVTHGNAVHDGSIIDVLCRLDGEPFAFMPVVSGKVQDVVAYDNSYDNKGGWVEESTRRELLEKHIGHVRQLCLDYIARHELARPTTAFVDLQGTLPLVTRFVCATAFEQRCLQERAKLGDWISVPRGLGRSVGRHETYVSFSFAYVKGELVAFYEPTSSVVHWADVESFVRSFGKRVIKADAF